MQSEEFYQIPPVERVDPDRDMKLGQIPFRDRINGALLDKVAARIEETPSEYDQTTWASELFDLNLENCGSSHCVAGWSVALGSTDQMDWENSEFASPGEPRSADYCRPKTAVKVNGHWVPRYSIAYAAKHLLGLTTDESAKLFNAVWASGYTPGEVADSLRKLGQGEYMELFS